MAVTRAPLEPYQKVFTALYLILGALCAVATVSVPRGSGLAGAAALLFLEGAFFVVCAVSYARGWRSYKGFVGVAGVLLVLCAPVVAFFGTEDVGGPWVAIPLGLAILAAGLWSLLLVVTEHR